MTKETQDLKDRRVFIVDDEPMVLKAVGQSILSLGCDVRTFESARACLEGLEEDDCDLIVSDVNMPDMDGISLLKEIKKIRPSIPVVVITGFGDVPAAVRALKAGAADFVEKPLDEASFLKVVKEYLLTSQARLESSLTDVERTVLRHVASGRSSKEIAEIMGRSQRTIENHRYRLTRKLGVEKKTELVQIAMKFGLVSDSDK